MIRKLGMAFSIGCGIACLLTFALWVRSYWFEDWLTGPLNDSKSLHVYSEAGWLTLSSRARPVRPRPWRVASQSIALRNEQEAKMLAAGATIVRTPPRLGVSKGPFSRALQAPYWLPVLLLATLAALPRMMRRFSLRHALVAMALVAAVLTAIVWAAR